MAFEDVLDAKRVLGVLGKRLARYGLTLGVQNAIASLSAHRYWSGAPSGTPRWEILLAPPICVMERID